MRVAVSIWKDRLSPVLDVACRLLVVSIHERREQYRFEADIMDQSITRICQMLKHLSVDTLICGAVSAEYLKALRDSGLTVIPGIAGTTREIVEAFIAGSLLQPQYFLPGRMNGQPAGGTTRQRKKRKARKDTDTSGIEP